VDLVVRLPLAERADIRNLLLLPLHLHHAPSVEKTFERRDNLRPGQFDLIDFHDVLSNVSQRSPENIDPFGCQLPLARKLDDFPMARDNRHLAIKSDLDEPRPVVLLHLLNRHRKRLQKHGCPLCNVR
jgi:hypothetical protein